MTEPAPVVCQTPGCGHDANRHGARAGVQPGRCLVPGCDCPRWTPPEPPQARLADPRTDRDLFLAWAQASASVEIGNPEAGYEIMMREIIRWHRRALGLPPDPERARDRPPN